METLISFRNIEFKIILTFQMFSLNLLNLLIWVERASLKLWEFGLTSCYNPRLLYYNNVQKLEGKLKINDNI